MKKRIVIYGSVVLALGCLIFFIKNPVGPHRRTVELQGVASPETLREIVIELADNPVFRNVGQQERLNASAQQIFQRLEQMGVRPQWQTFQARGVEQKNIIVRLGAEQPGNLIVIGAHYDVCFDTPGADDNASGVAGLLELTRLLKLNRENLRRPVELVFYTLEEPPYFYTSQMGSAIHADELAKNNETVDLMISIEMIGRFSDEPGSQTYPSLAMEWIYPTQGNFIALVGRLEDWSLTRKVKSILKSNSKIGIQSINAPTALPGIDFSDHLNYWNFEMPALMVSDTAFFRNLDYHKKTDTSDKLDYDRMAMVVNQLLNLPFEF